MKKTVFFGAALLALPALVLAQQAPAVTTSGSISAGTRQVDTDTNSSKFTEYRDYRDRALGDATFRIADPGTSRFFDFRGTGIGLSDQALAVRGGRTDAWVASLDWTGVPHNYSNKARTPYIRKGAGLFEVPANVPITFKKLATGTAADVPGVLASDALTAAYQQQFLAPTALDTQTWFGRAALKLTGSEALDLGVTYDLKNKTGLKPTYGPIGDRPPRTLNIQLTEPIDYRTQDVTLSAEHVGQRFQVQGSFLVSDFSNRVDTLLWENVYAVQSDQTSDTTWDRAVSTFGRRALWPDNRYQNASLTVGGTLPLDSRLNATVAYGRFDQDEALLPYSYNSDILADRTLPRATAQGKITTTQAIVDYVLNPASKVGLRAWARYYGMDNQTPQSRWRTVTSDTPNLNGSVTFKNKRLNEPYATDRTNAGAEATIRAGGAARSSVTVGYELEEIARLDREADTTEHRLTASLRVRPSARANLRVRYLFGTRQGDYDPFVTRESYWYTPSEVGTDTDNPQFAFDNHPDMRRFDVSDRRRQQADIVLTLSPVETFSLSASARYRKDDFDSGVGPVRPLIAGSGNPDLNATTPGIQLGRLDDVRQRYALDAFYAAGSQVSFNAFVGWDKARGLQRGIEFNENNKQNPGAIATAELGPWTRASSEWTADSADDTVTLGFGTTFTAVPDRLILTAGYTGSVSTLAIAYGGFGVTNFDGTPFAPNHQFSFSSPPDVTNDLHLIDLKAEIPVSHGFAFVVGYGFERYEISDWQQSGSQAWVETVGSEFLLRDTSRSYQWGNRLFNLGTYLAPSYSAHIGYAGFNYRF